MNNLFLSKIKLRYCFFVLLWLSPLLGTNFIHITKSDQCGVILEITPPDIRLKNIRLNGVEFQKIITSVDVSILNQPGSPELPLLSAIVALPDNVNPIVKILDFRFEDISGIYLAPAPYFEINSDVQSGSPIVRYLTDEAAYLQNQFLPEAPAKADTVSCLRGYHMAAIHIYPWQYNPAQKLLRRYSYLKVEVFFPYIESGNDAAIYTDIFDPLLSKTLINFSEAKHWQKAVTKSRLRKTEKDWYDPAVTYYKMLISQDGIYRLSTNDLTSYGIEPASVDPRTVKIFNKGVEMPIRVAGENDGVFNSNDYIEFYGIRNRGEFAFYDDYSDTNCYWLSFDGASGNRFSPILSLSGQLNELTNFRRTLHFERDLSYYNGDGNDVLNTERVSDEGWIWREFYPHEELTFSFNLNDVYFNETQLCSLKVKLKGITLDAVYPDHLAAVSINNQEIGRVQFDDRQSSQAAFWFSGSLLNSGTNQFKVQSVETRAALNKFLIDWFELSYPAAMNKSADYRQFGFPEDRSGKISLWNVKSPSMSIYNLTAKEWLTNAEFTNEQRFVVRLLSAGFDDGNFSQVTVNDIDLINGGIRGYNIAVFDTITNKMDGAYFFDKLGDPSNADSLAAMIGRILPGKLVLIAISDEASIGMNEAAYQALESVGSTLTRQLKFRDSFVLLGRKGATPGTVPELLVPAGQGQAILTDTLFAHQPTSKHLSFQAQFRANDQWIIAGEDSMKKPDRVTRHDYRNLKNEQNSADYIFITHNKFWQTADKFANFWAQKNYRTFVADIDDVYDEFNYGVKHVKAIKEFLKWAYENWQKPAPAFVLLIGDASWDPKKNSPTSTQTDYVPTYGSPVSDNWLVCFDGADDYLADMAIGRIAIQTELEGERIYQKVTNYSQLPTADWKKHLLFINGGFNDTEQLVFGTQSSEIINNYVNAPPASCVPTVISKELDGLYEGENREIIISEINSGKLWVNFIGHGGSGTWELMFHDQQVFELENQERLPLITSFTCHTGRFANPEIISFGENFVNYSDAGAIGFIGSSGWGFTYEDWIIAQKLFESALKDTIHQLGTALAMAKLKFWSMLNSSILTKSVVRQFNLLGDPALELTLPNKPDILIKAEDIYWSPQTPVETDSIVEFIGKIYNYGLATNDSVQFTVFDNFNLFGPVELFNTKLSEIGYTQQSTFPLAVHSKAGEHSLDFYLDPANLIDEVEKSNNRATATIYVGSSRLTISLPQENSILPADNLRIQVNNPAVQNSSSVYYFELDTMNNFNSTFLKQSGAVKSGQIVTLWNPPALQPETVYFWRSREEAGSTAGNWVTSNFSLGSSFGWRQKTEAQFEEDVFIGTDMTLGGVVLSHQLTTFRVESSGFDDFNSTVILVNSIPVITATRGHNVAVCDAMGNFLEFRNFDTFQSPEDVADMVVFLDGIPVGNFVLAGIRDSGEMSMTEAAYQALESIGSQFCRQVGFRDGWAIIGKKGAAIGSVPEKLVRRYDGEAIVEDTLKIYLQRGTVETKEIGPANGWHSVLWDVENPSQAAIFFVDVIGFNKQAGIWDTLMEKITQTNEIDISSINSKIYPLIKLKGTLSSNDRFSTPRLKDWQMFFEPVSDIAIANEAVELSADTLIEGMELTICADVFNVGYVSQDSVEIEIYYRNRAQEKNIIIQTIVENIEVGRYKNFSYSCNTRGSLGQNQIYIEIDPNNKINELSRHNNMFSNGIVVLPDIVAPELVVTYDGKKIQPGDYVAAKPVILVKVFDNNPAQIENDSTRFQLLLDGQRVNFQNNAAVISLLSVNNADDSTLKAIIKFTPELSDGSHVLEMLIKDANDKSVFQRDELIVFSKLALLNVYNYPNPFSEDTHFTFNLTQPAEKVTIKIYTTAGRLIHTIEHYGLTAGFNQLVWDGKDMDGDKLANGVYLYKIIARSGNNQTEKIEKLVVMR